MTPPISGQVSASVYSDLHRYLETKLRRRTPSLLVVWLLLTCTKMASGYCVLTTCEEGDECPRDEHGCLVSGQQLHWADPCFSFSVNEQGAPALDLSGEDLGRLTRQAFETWFDVRCEGGQPPGIGAVPLGAVRCDRPESNTEHPNANVIMFRNDGWPYPQDDRGVARTSSFWNTDTGALLDVDIEINPNTPLNLERMGDRRPNLETVLLHEAGHFLGLDHSDDPLAVMFEFYSTPNLGLSDDDRDGMCALYPPIAESERRCPIDTAPRNGFSRDCSSSTLPDGGCSVVPGLVGRMAPPRGRLDAQRHREAPLAALLVSALLFRRRSVRQALSK